MSLKKCIGSKLLGTNNVIVYWKNALLKFAESVFFKICFPRNNQNQAGYRFCCQFVPLRCEERVFTYFSLDLYIVLASLMYDKQRNLQIFAGRSTRID